METTVTGLIQEVVDGKIKNTATNSSVTKRDTRGTTDLGQDAFLQLLICEMQNQDPLEPTSNTEWISQLASFSQLEELQALSKMSEKSQLFSLVGKNVIVTTEDASGNKSLKSGIVDFISTSGTEARFSVDGELYSIKDLYSVVDADYIYEKNKPGVATEVQFIFDGDAPEDLEFEVSFGEDPAKATDVAVIVGNAIIASDYVTVDGSQVTVSGAVLQELEPGIYPFTLVFNDKNMTAVEDKITVTIFNSHPTGSDVLEEKEETAVAATE